VDLGYEGLVDFAAFAGELVEADGMLEHTGAGRLDFVVFEVTLVSWVELAVVEIVCHFGPDIEVEGS
jgi:hypothetical protein